MKESAFLLLRRSICLMAWPALACAQSDSLPAMGADLTRTSVSGISSGGFMTAQLATAYSGLFVGAGVIAAGPYYCAGTYADQSFLENATAACMSPLDSTVAANAAVSWRNAQRFAAAGEIDAVSNLARQRVYIFSGANDRTVKPVVVDEVAKYYALAGAGKAQIQYANNINAGHSIVTDREGDVACSDTREPFINNCGVKQAEVLLRHIYGERSAPSGNGPLEGKFIRFKQSEFITGTRSSMDDEAYAYIPKSCEQSACVVHVAFHGCLQGASKIGDRFYKGTGYNEFADKNNMIVLYPQAKASNGIPFNPKGCWDFWGYSDEDVKQPAFYTRKAPQMAAVVAMIRRLGQPRSAKP